jgi:uncharacterized protein YllA (UPF0747 family)
MIVAANLVEKMEALEMKPKDFFKPTGQLVDEIVKRYSTHQLNLTAEKERLAGLYNDIGATAGSVDPTLSKHVLALHAVAKKKIDQLEKKMLNAEKKKFEARQRQVEKIKDQLFPNNSLQERVDNIMPFYAHYGKGFIDILYKHSLGLKQEFCILSAAAE